MNGIMALARSQGIFVIEDCAQAHGAMIGKHRVGSIGDVGAWSFCQDKIMTTGGEGGMVTTNDPDLWNKMWSFKDHGKSWDAVYERDHPAGFRFVHDTFGTNWRMMEIQSAIGRIQLERMTYWTARRSAIANIISQSLKQFPNAIRVPLPDKSITHAYYRLYAYICPEGLQTGWDRDRIVAEISATGVPLMHGTCSEVYLEKAFDNTGLRPNQRLAIAKELGQTSLMFMIHPTLSDSDARKISEVTTDVFRRAIR